MVYTMLSLDDFSGMEFTSNMTPIDYLFAVSEVFSLKSMYGEEDNLIAEQDEEFRIRKKERITQNIKSILSSFPQVLDHQEEKSILDSVISRKKRSMTKTMPRKVTEKFICSNGEKLMIKKAVENRGNRVSKINSNGNDIIRKRTREVANDDQEQKKIKRNIVIVRVEAPIINRELDIEFKNLIWRNGGSLESVKLVIEKKLFKSDVKPGEGRLSIPQKKMLYSFLEPDEDAYLSTRNGEKMCEMKVLLIEPSRRKSEINLRKWFMNKDNGKVSLSYVLVTYWNEVVRRNKLELDTNVQLWAFRKGADLCFALVKL